ncbi:MAG: serine hydrolase domain-containing protein [Woeseiaceae bacterium]|nr:serine hydrolase domain-containing protein [Woeseiaceae bacterium]
MSACQEKAPTAGAESIAFVPADDFDTVQAQHRRLPDDDIWWNVAGPDMAWNHRNLHQLFPTVNVYRNGPVRTLERAPLAAIADYPVETEAGTLTFDEFIASDHSTVLGIVILKDGRIVYERYPRMQHYEMPVTWSVAKVFVGAVVRILEERGEIDVSRPIEAYLPELAESSLAGTTIRNFLDMASGLDCGDEYVDRDSCYYRYSMALGDGFRTADAPDNPYDFAADAEIARIAEQGTVFSYSGFNTFVLAWLVERVTGAPFQDALTGEIWYHMGAESNASYVAYRYGIPVTHGAFVARMRDMARFGLLYTPSWRLVSDRQIISDAHIDFLYNAGRPELLANAGDVPPGVRHNIYQWGQVMENGDIFMGGWGGQGLLVNPQRDVVAVFTGFFRDDARSEIATEPLVRAMLDDVFGN